MKYMLLAALGMTAVVTTADGPPAATYKVGSELTAALAAGQATPDMLTSPVAISDRHRINLIKRTKAAGAVAHEGFAELHHIVEGSGTLVTGGAIVRATGAGRGSGGATIQSGVSRHVAKGDVILIPPGMPHWYKDLDGTITYLEVRWEEK
jgi:mannose-6-phosphate isomerase-like protein (cupin superfamily)